MNHYRICLLFLFLLSSFVFPQSTGWKNYTEMKYINELLPESDGIWAATNGGVFKYSFSNNNYQKFTSSEGLKSTQITAIAKDKFNRIWMGGNDGSISIFNPEKNSWTYNADIYNSSKINKKITNIFIKDSTAYISTEFGVSLVRVSDNRFGDTYTKLGTFTADSKVNGVLIEDTLWVATEKGIAVQKSKQTNYLPPESWTNITLPATNSNQNINCLIKYHDTVFAGSIYGLYNFNGTSTLSLKFPQLSNIEIIGLSVRNDTLFITSKQYIFSYSKGILENTFTVQKGEIKCSAFGSGRSFAGTTLGLLDIKKNITNYIYPNSPNSNLFVSMQVDGKGTLWAASGTDVSLKGFYKLSNGIWRNFLKQDYPFFFSDAFHKVNKTSGDVVWVNSWGGGFYKISNDSVIVRYFQENTPLRGIPKDQNFIVGRGVAEDSKGNIWFLTYQTQNILAKLTKDSTWQFYQNGINSSAYHVHELVIDDYDTKYFIHEEKDYPGGIYYFNETGALPKQWGFISTSNGLNSVGITCLAVDRTGEIWVGTSAGVNVLYNPLRPEQQVQSIYALRNQNVNCIVVDGLNQKWIGTRGNGVWVMNNDGTEILAQYNQNNSPVLSNDIKSIAIDSKTGIVNIGTEYGLSTLQSVSIEPLEEFTKLNIYPSPFIQGKHQKVAIDGLVENSTIKIFSINGSLIRVLNTPGGRVGFWDGKDESGKEVETGVYMVVAYNSEATKIITGKLALIKK